jgi:hypothetical protein
MVVAQILILFLGYKFTLPTYDINSTVFFGLDVCVIGNILNEFYSELLFRDGEGLISH